LPASARNSVDLARRCSTRRLSLVPMNCMEPYGNSSATISWMQRTTSSATYFLTAPLKRGRVYFARTSMDSRWAVQLSYHICSMDETRCSSLETMKDSVGDKEFPTLVLFLRHSNEAAGTPISPS